jgi:hypothetical protein
MLQKRPRVSNAFQGTERRQSSLAGVKGGLIGVPISSLA